MRENCRVRGIGVALMVSVSTFTFSCFSFSFTATPNFCSSSTIRVLEVFKFHTLPDKFVSADRDVDFPGFKVGKNLLHLLGLFGARYELHSHREFLQSLGESVVMLCIASTVVGTSTAVCLLSAAALKAARMAISVFPNPTPPHMRRCHWAGRLHVAFHVLRSLQLVGGVFIDEACLKLVFAYKNREQMQTPFSCRPAA